MCLFAKLTEVGILSNSFTLFHLFVHFFLDPNQSVWKCDPALSPSLYSFGMNFPGSNKYQIKSFPVLPRKRMNMFEAPCFFFNNLQKKLGIFLKQCLSFIWYGFLCFVHFCGICTLIHEKPMSPMSRCPVRHDPSHAVSAASPIAPVDRLE